jgi:hypothetical protein
VITAVIVFVMFAVKNRAIAVDLHFISQSHSSTPLDYHSISKAKVKVEKSRIKTRERI